MVLQSLVTIKKVLKSKVWKNIQSLIHGIFIKLM